MDPHQRKVMFVVAVLLGGGGLVLLREAWVSSPKLHVPSSIAYVLAIVLFAAAPMVVFEIFGVWRWNDLLAAVLLLGVTAEMLWLTFGSGPPRKCQWGWWQPPEAVCRTMIGIGALICGATSAWAIARYRAGRGLK